MSPTPPLVSIVCTVRNQRPYVAACLESVRNQSYKQIELIVIDNASTDGSLEEVCRVLDGVAGATVIRNRENEGLCRAFNKGWRMSRGKYLVDLSGDDVLFPDRIARQVAFFEALPPEAGVIFSNARHIDASGKPVGWHYPVDKRGKARVEVPSGYLFREVLRRYFISTPTLMIHRRVLEALEGYDETLAYEDFDFMVRSSRNYPYFYQDEILTAKRLHKASLGAQILAKENPLLESTYVVCRKAFHLCRTGEEQKVLAARIQTFIRKCFYTEQFGLASRFYMLLPAGVSATPVTKLVLGLCRLQLPVNRLYKRYRLFMQYLNRITRGRF